MSFFLTDDVRKFVDDRTGVFDNPKTVIVFVECAFLMEISNLVEDVLIDRRSKSTEWFSATGARSYYESRSRWSIVHLWEPIHER